MGIQGLLPLLSPIHRPIHIKEFNGQKIAIDAYVWLHRGAYGCANELAKNLPTTKYIDYCMKRVFYLKELGIIPLLVFDGGYLPMKQSTEEARRLKRRDNFKKGLEFEALGQATKALECFQSCVDIDPNMAHALILELRKYKIEYIVAPYEADAQLRFLEMHGIVSGIITEDSDLLAFGCQNVVFKLEFNGNATLIQQKDFGNIKEFRNWTETKFRQMCILSGCDYLPSPVGIGLKKAQTLLQKTDAHKLIRSWNSWGKAVKAPKGLDPSYLDKFTQAELTFLHQRVYDPIKKELVYLHPIETSNWQYANKDDFLGPLITHQEAHEIAIGNMNPISKTYFTCSSTVSVLDESSSSLTNKPTSKANTKSKTSIQLKENHPFTTNPSSSSSFSVTSSSTHVKPLQDTKKQHQSSFKKSHLGKFKKVIIQKSTPSISSYFIKKSSPPIHILSSDDESNDVKKVKLE